MNSAFVPHPNPLPFGDVDQLLDTQKVWSPIAQLQEIHEQAIKDLSVAMMHGDEVAQKIAADTIAWVEEQQEKAHVDALAYHLSKVQK